MEVPGQAVAEQVGGAHGHVGVAREVAVDLQGVGQRGDPDRGAAVGRGVGEHLVGERCHAVRDGQLLEHAHQEELDSQVRPRPAPVLAAADLRQEVARPHDRPGHQVREERDEQQEVRQAPFGPCLAAVDVDGVVDRLERVERDPHREDHPQNRERGLPAAGAHCLLQRAQEEVGILEVCQKAQIAGDADAHEASPQARRRGPLQAEADEVVDCRRREDHQLLPASGSSSRRSRSSRRAGAAPARGASAGPSTQRRRPGKTAEIAESKRA